MNFFRRSSSSTSSSSVLAEESMTHHSQQRRLANPNLVFLKRKNEREKRIMEDNSLIFGFENPSRSLCPITADPDNVKFLGTNFGSVQSSMPKNFRLKYGLTSTVQSIQEFRLKFCRESVTLRRF